MIGIYRQSRRFTRALPPPVPHYMLLFFLFIAAFFCVVIASTPASAAFPAGLNDRCLEWTDLVRVPQPGAGSDSAVDRPPCRSFPFGGGHPLWLPAVVKGLGHGELFRC
jgi:hypothetical protein